VLTHLARADEEKSEHTERQYKLFKKLKNILIDRGNLKQAKFSICNSAAILDGNLDDFDWVRPGLALYGCYPNPRQIPMMDLKPVLELKSKILSLKQFTPHSFIGYGGTFETKKESQIAVLPIGYADGYPRLVSNRGHVLVAGKKAPVVGRVSMDLMAIDVTDVEGVKLYDDVTLIGQDGTEIIHAEDVAKWAETISYEILCGVSARVPRIYEGM
jgi:alanine racemase